MIWQYWLDAIFTTSHENKHKGKEKMETFNSTENAVTEFQICKVFFELETIGTKLRNITAEEHMIYSWESRKECTLSLLPDIHSGL